ncbi:MAG: glycosyltransferase family 4 protein [Gammaproteobacteria bacterium]|nr:glycosyltransferase family 4 protein [Gammaproteobacteria bacterium]
MLKILVIGYVWPEPASSAAGSRMIQFLNLFKKQGWDVTYTSPAAESEFMYDMESLDIKCLSIELNNSSFDKFILNLQPDIVLYDRFMMEEQFSWRVERNCPLALGILETVDLHCLRDARQQALKKNRKVVDQDYFSDIAKREIASILRCDLSLMISNVEIDILEDIFNINSELLHYVPFMLDTVDREKIMQWPSYIDRKNFITIGNFKHAPNWDAVLFLKKTIWPLIRKKLPDVECHIYGAYAGEKVYQLNNVKDGFIIKGRAEDADSVVREARVCLAPLRFGAGIKGKLVEAMLNGTPSVTTLVGSESMHKTLPWNGFIEDDPLAFSDAAVELYENNATWLKAQNNGITIINTVYNNDEHGAGLIEKINFLRKNIGLHRLNNFTGAMLKHHSMKSTEYMSRWIEEKSKIN